LKISSVVGSRIHTSVAVGVICFLFNLQVSAINPVSVDNILQESFKVNQSIDSISLTILLNERVNNKIIRKKTDFKIIQHPYQVYFIQHYPNEGMECLYNEKLLGKKALINRNTVAFSSIKLDPSGNIMRNGNHHSLFKAGFGYLVNVLQHLADKYPPATSNYWTYMGVVKYDDQLCYKISFKNPNFGYTDYTIKPGENLEVIAMRDMLSDYMIFEKNPEFNSFDDFTPGKTIKVPTDYAQEIIIYIQKDLMVPIGLKTYDPDGLFEEYTYKNIVMRPRFSSKDFDYNNPQYGF